ncbi:MULTISPECIES: plasmid replication initiator TrfA [Pseudomonas]|uniref:Plasmid replication initiator protein TrfA n=1 Tax=Pseudomonas fluorescens TaxID=294 RepID=A0A109L828_PSEFL|nr:MULTISPECIES: plasmid replication initiator TrfA [Pseudomonas]KWV82729.1 Plasmid replication initiator protein TrfA [Pseudomonas fluorescens]MBM1206938.1 hypothetical protein [Pseudomonas fragi]NNB04149.1 hypothetical protein [Pseudomonas fragi]
MGPLTKVRELEARASATTSALRPADAPAPRLQNWRELYRALPNAVLRSALFAVIGKGQRARLDGTTITSQAGIALTYSGEQLDQSDLDLWATLLHLLRNHPLDQEFHTSIYALLKGLGITDTGPSRTSLKHRLLRLSSCELSIRTASFVYEGNLIKADYLEGNKPLVLGLNPSIIGLFASDQFTLVHWGVRCMLSGSPLAQWLHGYYSTHAAPYPVRIDTLHKLSGSKTVSPSKFLQLLRRALDRLALASAEHGQKFTYQIDGELVSVNKRPSPSQERHISKRQNRTVTAGKPYRHSG